MGIKKIVIAGVVALAVAHFAWGQSSPTNVTDSTSIFERGYIQVTGVSEKGQTRINALRAAQSAAQRTLLETVQNLQFQGKTTVKKAMLESDEIRSMIEMYLRGAVTCGENYQTDKGYAEACLRIPLRGPGGFYKLLVPFIHNTTLETEKKAQPRFTTKSMMTETAPEAPPTFKPAPCPSTNMVYDGLILDLRHLDFKPALANRVLDSRDELIFGPARIAGNVLVERGCGGFTTDLSKAKAMLAQWGSACPLILIPEGLEQETDVRLSEEDAAMLLMHDQQSALLAQAKVVYLLK
jgi:hypothetical protein